MTFRANDGWTKAVALHGAQVWSAERRRRVATIAGYRRRTARQFLRRCVDEARRTLND